jgi:hypothetical protein
VLFVVAYQRHGGTAEREPMKRSFGLVLVLAAASVFAKSLSGKIEVARIHASLRF